MSDDYAPHKDLTPLRASVVPDPKLATTRRFRCTNCGAEQECPPCPPSILPERVTTALVPKIVGLDVEPMPFPEGPEQPPTRILRPIDPAIIPGHTPGTPGH